MRQAPALLQRAGTLPRPLAVLLCLGVGLRRAGVLVVREQPAAQQASAVQRARLRAGDPEARTPEARELPAVVRAIPEQTPMAVAVNRRGASDAHARFIQARLGLGRPQTACNDFVKNAGDEIR